MWLCFAGLLKFLKAENIEGMAEATRVFGNLSRDKSVRDFLTKHKGSLLVVALNMSKFAKRCTTSVDIVLHVAVDEMMVVLLDSGKSEVVFAAVGVLINLMADDEKRPFLKNAGGVSRWVHFLSLFACRIL